LTDADRATLRHRARSESSSPTAAGAPRGVSHEQPVFVTPAACIDSTM
jgi:hypothetical protein